MSEKLNINYVLAAIDDFKRFIKVTTDENENLLECDDIYDFLVEAFDAYIGHCEMRNNPGIFNIDAKKEY